MTPQAPYRWANHSTPLQCETTFKRNAYALTGLAFRQYSDAMQQELDSLEDKLGQVVQMLSRLRAENVELRQQVAAKTDEIARLAEKLTTARARVENLLKQIPETEP